MRRGIKGRPTKAKVSGFTMLELAIALTVSITLLLGTLDLFALLRAKSVLQSALDTVTNSPSSVVLGSDLAALAPQIIASAAPLVEVVAISCTTPAGTGSGAGAGAGAGGTPCCEPTTPGCLTLALQADQLVATYVTPMWILNRWTGLLGGGGGGGGAASRVLSMGAVVVASVVSARGGDDPGEPPGIVNYKGAN